ncbi:ROK family protein [Aureimonas pseudogalii]|uniref:Putative NBD/HSP70 family sugar kinase n=1 Tax=Aureimonas pseudogalii TaxID=1744844 RepID=A0A7W6H959_9HYPH|nr:ROK family protein [Aureimonas pseudogalii]MBB4000802.1 putative NBD/HSP70 family sugar kinase [Aureimonas pseudogalii]
MSRALNRRLVLDRLRRNGPSSRSELAVQTGLSAGAVTLVTAELIGEGLVVEGKMLPGSGGRRPVEVEIAYAARVAIGLKLMADRVLGVLTDLSTEPLTTVELPLSEPTPDRVVEICAAAVGRLLEHPGARARPLIGIGLGLPGVIDAQTGTCRFLHRFGWKDVPFAEMLAARVAAPVWVDNDVSAFALAQYLFGAGRMRQNLVAVAVGRGVCAGIVIDGKLYRGHSGGAGEIGHILSEPNGRLCDCGRLGCLEAYISDPALARIWGETGGGRPGAGESLAAAAAAGDPIAVSVLADAGRRLGRHVAQIANFFAPDIIVMGGEAVRYGPAFFGPALEELEPLCFAGMPPVVVDWQDQAWTRGASALAIQHFFNFEAISGYPARAPLLAEAN